MPKTVTLDTPEGPLTLKDPPVAGFLALLWPGAGHLYQGRVAKGVLFMICILGIYFFGLFLGEGRVVYASWKPQPFRWAYICQVWTGLPAWPALIEAKRFQQSRQAKPLFPRSFFVPPRVDPPQHPFPDELDDLHRRLGRFFEYGTVYTMVAGLLNILAIYDACCGPAYVRPKPTKKEPDNAKER